MGAIEEAHAAGLKLAAHAWTAAGALNAAKAGVDSIEHAVAAIKAEGTRELTFAIMEHLEAHPRVLEAARAL